MSSALVEIVIVFSFIIMYKQLWTSSCNMFMGNDFISLWVEFLGDRSMHFMFLYETAKLFFQRGCSNLHPSGGVWASSLPHVLSHNWYHKSPVSSPWVALPWDWCCDLFPDDPWCSASPHGRVCHLHSSLGLTSVRVLSLLCVPLLSFYQVARIPEHYSVFFFKFKITST